MFQERKFNRTSEQPHLLIDQHLPRLLGLGRRGSIGTHTPKANLNMAKKKEKKIIERVT